MILSIAACCIIICFPILTFTTLGAMRNASIRNRDDSISTQQSFIHVNWYCMVFSCPLLISPMYTIRLYLSNPKLLKQCRQNENIRKTKRGINRFSPATFVCLSQTRTWISNVICCGL